MMLKGEGGRNTGESIGGVVGFTNVYKERSQPTLDFILIWKHLAETSLLLLQQYKGETFSSKLSNYSIDWQLISRECHRLMSTYFVVAYVLTKLRRLFTTS
jgi:hypothetical protein